MMKIILFLQLASSVFGRYQPKVPHFAFNVSLRDIENDAKRLYKIFRPEVDISKIEYLPVHKGKKNAIDRLDDPTSRKAVIFRTHLIEAFDSEMIAKRELELASFDKASQLGITSTLRATYDNGLICDWIDGEAISVEKLSTELLEDAARKIAIFHTISIDDIELASKEPILNAKKNYTIPILDGIMKETPEVYPRIPLFSEVVKEFDNLTGTLEEKQALGRVVFCHNSLGIGHMMIEHKTKKIFIIDFINANTNYEYVDISNFFVRFGSIVGQKWKPKDVPNEKKRKIFLRSYLRESNTLTSTPMDDKQLDDFVNKEARKVVACMLVSEFQLVKDNLYSNIIFKKPRELHQFGDLYIPMYEHYVKNKRKYMDVLDGNVTIDENEIEPTERKKRVKNSDNWTSSALCLLTLGHIVLRYISFFKF